MYNKSNPIEDLEESIKKYPKIPMPKIFLGNIPEEWKETLKKYNFNMPFIKNPYINFPFIIDLDAMETQIKIISIAKKTGWNEKDIQKWILEIHNKTTYSIKYVANCIYDILDIKLEKNPMLLIVDFFKRLGGLEVYPIHIEFIMNMVNNKLFYDELFQKTLELLRQENKINYDWWEKLYG